MTSEVKNNYAYVITQYICNKFIEVFFLWDVWFLGQIVYFEIEHPSIINKIACKYKGNLQSSGDTFLCDNF